jgi:acetamidase/formamidase
MKTKREVIVTYGRSGMKRPSKSAKRFDRDQVVFAEDYHWIFVPKQESLRIAYSEAMDESPDTLDFKTFKRSKKYFIFTSEIQSSRSEAVDLMFVSNFEGKADVGCLILEDEFMFFWRKEGI